MGGAVRRRSRNANAFLRRPTGAFTRGARKRTRTSNPLRELAPEASAYTNSAIRAWGAPISHGRQGSDYRTKIAICQSLLPGEFRPHVELLEVAEHIRRRNTEDGVPTADVLSVRKDFIRLVEEDGRNVRSNNRLRVLQ
mgnify:CR=1 FL=1